MTTQFTEPTKSLAQSAPCRPALKKCAVGVGLAVLLALPVIIPAGDLPDRSPGLTAVTGNSDWSIVPANLTPPFVFVGSDGDYYVRHLPLVGKISLSGRGFSVEGKISADFNSELDATFSGPFWAPVTITETVNGSKHLLFEGHSTGNTTGLVSAGVIKLDGRGPYKGTRLVIEFTEIGPGNTDTYSLKGALIPGYAD